MQTTSWPRRVVVAVSIAALSFVLLIGVRALASLLLLFFGGVVAAAFLRAAVVFVHKHTRMNEGVALALTIVALTAFSVGAGMVLLPRIADQIAAAPLQIERVKDSIAQLVSQTPWLEQLSRQVRGDAVATAGRDVLVRAFGVLSGALGLLASIALLLFVAVYLAIAPREYLKTALQLVPVPHRARVERAMLDAGTVLQRWIVGRLLSMLIVGVGTGVGLWIIDSPLVLTLAFLAAVLNFVPYVGPALSAVPALVLAIPQGLHQVAWVAAVYTIVQLVESYIVTPQIQQRAVRIAPAYLLLAQSALGLISGALGFLFATPLVACLSVLVRELYVEHALHDAGHEDEA